MGFLTDRHAFNVAVPAEGIQAALARFDLVRAKQTDRAWMTQQLQQTCFQFVSELSTPFVQNEQLLYALSDAIIIAKGDFALHQLSLKFAQMSTPDEIEATKRFVENPYLMMHGAILEAMNEDFQGRGGPAATERCDRIQPGDDVLAKDADVRTVFTFQNNSRVAIVWRFAAGRWTLVDLKEVQ